MILTHWFEQSNENVLTIGGSEDGLGVDDGSGRRVVMISKDVNATTITV